MLKRLSSIVFLIWNYYGFCQNAKEILQQFKAAQNDSVFCANNSSLNCQLNIAYSHGINSMFDSIALLYNKGEIVGPVIVGEQNFYLKITGIDSSYKMSAAHILFCETGQTYCPVEQRIDHDSAVRLSEYVLVLLKSGKNFAELCAKYSSDPGSNTKGGEYLDFFEGQMVREFEEGVKKHKPGEVFLIDTMYGRHVVKSLSKPIKDRYSVKYILIEIKP